MPTKKHKAPAKSATSRKQIQTRLRSLTTRAKKGDAAAQRELAGFYATDEAFGLKDEPEAVKWYTKAAEGGDAESQYNLGLMIVIGQGTEKDLETGIAWMERAVKHGYKLAAHVLTIMYRQGMYGIQPSSTKAEYWNKKAGSFKEKG